MAGPEMTAASTAALFAILSVLAITPGPTDVLLVTRSLKSGTGHGLVMVCGILAADFFFILVAVTGLATILKTFGGLSVVIKYAAVSYLLWMGIAQLRRRELSIEVHKPETFSRSASFSTGFLATLADPKAIFGYMSLLPAFLDLGNITFLDITTIMIVVTIAVGGAKTCYVFLAGQGRRFIENPSGKRILDLLAGGALLATAVFLLSRS